VLASERRQRYTIYTKTPKNIKEKKKNFRTGQQWPILDKSLAYSIFIQ
jgi:hypothetical protein